jgi:hypothetical protein
MATPKILRIHSVTDLQSHPELLLALSDFDVISVAAIADAQSVLARQDVDCVLVEGPVPDGDRMLARDRWARAGGLLRLGYDGG